MRIRKVSALRLGIGALKGILTARACFSRKVAGGQMAHQARTFDLRDALSLVASIAALAAFACLWQFRDAYAGLPYAAFTYIVSPAAAIAIPFFISSHFGILHLPARVLQILKPVCWLLAIAYFFLIAVLLHAGGDIFHSLIMAAYSYYPLFVPYLAIASGLVLGTRS